MRITAHIAAFVKKAAPTFSDKKGNPIDPRTVLAPYRSKVSVTFTHASAPGKPILIDERGRKVDPRDFFNRLRDELNMDAEEFGRMFGVKRRTADGWYLDPNSKVDREAKQPGFKSIALLAAYLQEAA